MLYLPLLATSAIACLTFTDKLLLPRSIVFLHSHVLAAVLHYCSTPALTDTVLALRFAASRFETMLLDSFKMCVTFLVTIGLLCLSFALSSVSASAKNVSYTITEQSHRCVYTFL
jgi:hypothetical protein